MNLIRRLLCIPVSAIIAILFGIAWSTVFHGAYFSTHHLLASIVGLAPSYLGRLLPVVLFIVLGTVIAPSPGKPIIIFLGLLGGLYGAPFTQLYELAGANATFYLVDLAGTISGVGVGMILAFVIASRRKTKPAASTAS